MSLYENGAVRIHFEEAGTGFPLLVIPGGVTQGGVRLGAQTGQGLTEDLARRTLCQERVVGAVAALGVCPLQCDQQLLSQRVAGGWPSAGLLDQLHACIAQQLTVAAYFRRLRQHCLQQLAYFGGRGSGFFGRCQGKQSEAALQGGIRCGLGQLAQYVLAPALAGEAVGVHFPTVVAQYLPVFGGRAVRRRQRGGQGGGNAGDLMGMLGGLLQKR